MNETAAVADLDLDLLAFGAHPDDCELRVGGVALLVAGVLATRSRRRGQTTGVTLRARPNEVTSDDWESSTWDPEFQRDIERRRGADPMA